MDPGPLTPATLVLTLQQATSSAPQLLAISDHRLSAWEVASSTQPSGSIASAVDPRTPVTPTSSSSAGLQAHHLNQSQPSPTTDHDSSVWTLLLHVACQEHLPLDIDLITTENAGTPPTQEQLAQRADAVRLFAAIRFKNAVEKYWRRSIVSRGAVSIPKQVKPALRNLLLQSALYTPPPALSAAPYRQLALAVSRVARHDYPSEWPDLFEAISTCMGRAYDALSGSSSASAGAQDVHSATHSLLRSADVLARCLKELESVRILAGKIRITELARSMMPDMQNIFHTYQASMLPPPDASLPHLEGWFTQPMLREKILTSHALLKALRTLSVADMGTLTRGASSEGGRTPNHALSFFHSLPAVLQRFQQVRATLTRLLAQAHGGGGARPPDQSHAAVMQAMAKLFLGFGKYYLALAAKDGSKAPLWEGWSDVVVWYWSQSQRAPAVSLDVARDQYASPESMALELPPRFVVQSLVLLKQTLLRWKNAPPSGCFLESPSFVEEASDALVSRMLRLTRDDVERWMADPEEFENAEDAETYDVEIRPAAERALLAMAQNSALGPRVIASLWRRWAAVSDSSAAGKPDPAGLELVLERDAIMAAMGRCWDIFPRDADAEEYVDLSRFAVQTLVPLGAAGAEAGPNWTIIRRRTAWLVNQWSERIDVDDRPRVYALIVHLLGAGSRDGSGGSQGEANDVAVRLAAAKSLGSLTDALEFQPDQFEPLLGDALDRLVDLLGGGSSQLSMVESVRTCTNTLSVLIERMGARCAAHVEGLAQLVPSLWQAEDPDVKAKPGLVVLLGKLIRSVELIPDDAGPLGRLVALVEPIVRESLSPSYSLMLGKDALQLWLRALRASDKMSEPLFRLLALSPDLLAKADFCPETCRIIEESALLAARELLQTYGHAVLSCMATIVQDPTSPIILAIMGAVDVLVQAAESAGAVDELLSLLDASGFFAFALHSLLHVEDAVIISANVVLLLARICIASPRGAFHALVHSCPARFSGSNGQAAQGTAAAMWKPLITTWCERFESLSSARKRKVAALGLARVLRDADPQRDAPVFGEVAQMVTVWTDALADVKEDASGDADAYHRLPSPTHSMAALSDDGDWLEDPAPGAARLSALQERDAALRVRLGDAISEALNQAQASYGPALLADVDSLVLDMLRSDLAAA